MAPTSESIAEIDPPSAVLLLGSGFSLESTNLYGKFPPNGPSLRKHFLDKLQLPPDTTYELQVLAEEFANNSDTGLYRELYNIFHIAKVGPTQEILLREQWLRIYTTNYDDTVEVSRHRLHTEETFYTSFDPLPNRLKSNCIVHLHGSIGRLTEDNVLDQLVRGESSYVRQYLSKSPWYTQFQGDIKFASNLFVIGYNLSDYHISALLLENPLLAQRTFFIQPTKPDAVFVRRTSNYGKTLFVGVEGFAALLKCLPRAKPLSDVTRLKSFRALDPLRDKKGLRPPTAIEVLNLLVYGTFNYSRCAATLPSENYVIARGTQIREFLEAFANSKSVIVESRLGNGKTIFLYLALLALAEKGYSCFMFRSAGPTLEQELNALVSVAKPVIIFDEYTSSQDVIHRITEKLPTAKFVVEIRTSIFEVRYHEVSQSIPKPYARVSLNRLLPVDLSAFKRVCASAGIPTRKLEVGGPIPELRELLLQLLESPNIKTKIDTAIRPLFEIPTRRQVLLLTMLLGKFHLSADASFIRTVTGVDPYHEFRPFKEVSDELFETDAEEFRIRSAVFADFALQHFLTAGEITDCIVDAVVCAAARKVQRVYRVLLSNLMQYSNLVELFRHEVNANPLITQLYERLRYDERINDEPLYWLQYAIAVTDAKELLLAEQFIRTSYDRAAARTGFRTYQIDTQAFRIFLLIETEAECGAPVARIQEILEKLELLDSMLKEESHRSFAVRVLEGIGPFIENRRGDLVTSERTALMFWLSRITGTLAGLPADYKARVGSELTRRKLDSSKDLLLQA